MAALTFSLCLALFGAVFGQDCGRSLFYPEGRIIGGVPASACSVPWHAQVHFLPNNADPAFNPSQDLNAVNTLNCGAVILDELHVLISPTCMFLYGTDVSNLLSRVLIAAGDNDVSIFPETSVLGTQQEQFGTPDSIYFQDEYTIRTQAQLFAGINPSANDFRAFRDNQCGIIKLKAPLVMNNCVNKICLPTAADDPACTYKGCILTGNGLITSTTDGSQPTRNNQTDIIRMTALPPAACAVLERMGNAQPSTNSLCAKSETGGFPCINDNGGALACFNTDTQRWFLRGAALVDNCSAASASGFADVSQCLPFIERTLAGLSTPAV
ncbi:mannan-binding lectin serine protease 2-like [Haliotis rubra]|uniref:mannan-binding lectin serine protease 2-like n=1 Tax=Haliotis rubra TaxID=36100 RepID=UPI001EE5216E|nr:mannan-binding lectin serine protease 2-like [Haliotis rubra]